MLNMFLSWSIRKHLIILLVLFALPSTWLVIHRGIDGRNEAMEEARKDCLRLVNTIATEQQAVVGRRATIGSCPCQSCRKCSLSIIRPSMSFLRT